MPRFFKKVMKKSGLAPGTLLYTNEKRMEKAKITIIDYDEKQFQEKEVETVEECFPFRDTPTVTWINVDGVHQVDIIENIGRYFELHPLILEDIMNTDKRPKMEDFENYIYIVLKMLYYDEEKRQIICRDCGAIFEELTPKNEKEFEKARNQG